MRAAEAAAIMRHPSWMADVMETTQDGPFHDGARWRCAACQAREERAQPIAARPRLFLTFLAEGVGETSFVPSAPTYQARMCDFFVVMAPGAV